MTTEPDPASVQRTSPAEAAEEGYPISDMIAEDAASLAARAATAPAAEGLSDSERREFAERYLAQNADGDLDGFLRWLSTVRPT